VAPVKEKVTYETEFQTNTDSLIKGLEKARKSSYDAISSIEDFAKAKFKSVDSILDRSAKALNSANIKSLKRVLSPDQFKNFESSLKNISKNVSKINFDKKVSPQNSAELEKQLNYIEKIVSTNQDSIGIFKNNIDVQDTIISLLQDEGTLYTEQVGSLRNIYSENVKIADEYNKYSKMLQKNNEVQEKILLSDDQDEKSKKRLNALARERRNIERKIAEINEKQQKLLPPLKEIKQAKEAYKNDKKRSDLGKRDLGVFKTRLGLRAKELIEQGKSSKEAFRQARKEFGAQTWLEKAKEKLQSKKEAVSGSTAGKVGAATVGRTAGALGLGGMGAMLGVGAVGAFAAAMISAEKQVKDARREILRMAASTGELESSGIQVGKGFSVAHSKIEEYRLATQKYVNQFGISIKETEGAFAALTAQGFKLEKITSGDIFANFYAQSVLTGKSIDELAQTAGQMRVEFSKDSDQASSAFSMFRKQVTGTGLTTSMFFDKIMNATTGLGIYGDRIAKTSALISTMSKFAVKANIPVKAVTETTEKLSRGFADLSTEDQLITLKLAGSEKSIDEARKAGPQQQATFQLDALKNIAKSMAPFEGMDDLKSMIDKINSLTGDEQSTALLAFEKAGEVAKLDRDQIVTIKEMISKMPKGMDLLEMIKASEKTAKNDEAKARSKANKEAELAAAKQARIQTRPVVDAIEQNLVLWLQKIFAVIEPGFNFVKKWLGKGLKAIMKGLDKIPGIDFSKELKEMDASEQVNDLTNQLLKEGDLVRQFEKDQAEKQEELVELNKKISITKDPKELETLKNEKAKKESELKLLKDKTENSKSNLKMNQAIIDALENSNAKPEDINKLTELSQNRTKIKGQIELAKSKPKSFGKSFITDQERQLKSAEDLLKSYGVKLPEMAEGGIVKKRTPAIVGEAGTEAITPLDTLQNFISKAVDTAMISGGMKGAQKALSLAKASPIAKKAVKSVPGLGAGLAIQGAASAGSSFGHRLPGGSEEGKSLLAPLLKGLGAIVSVAGTPGAAAQTALDTLAEQQEKKTTNKQKGEDWARQQINDNKTVNIFVNHKEAEHIKQVVREEMYTAAK